MTTKYGKTDIVASVVEGNYEIALYGTRAVRIRDLTMDDDRWVIASVAHVSDEMWESGELRWFLDGVTALWESEKIKRPEPKEMKTLAFTLEGTEKQELWEYARTLDLPPAEKVLFLYSLVWFKLEPTAVEQHRLVETFWNLGEFEDTSVAWDDCMRMALMPFYPVVSDRKFRLYNSLKKSAENYWQIVSKYHFLTSTDDTALWKEFPRDGLGLRIFGNHLAVPQVNSFIRCQNSLTRGYLGDKSPSELRGSLMSLLLEHLKVDTSVFGREFKEGEYPAITSDFTRDSLKPRWGGGLNSWQTDDEIFVHSLLTDSEVSELINVSKTMYMTLCRHDFSWGQDNKNVVQLITRIVAEHGVENTLTMISILGPDYERRFPEYLSEHANVLPMVLDFDLSEISPQYALLTIGIG